MTEELLDIDFAKNQHYCDLINITIPPSKLRFPTSLYTREALESVTRTRKARDASECTTRTIYTMEANQYFTQASPV